IDLKLSLSTIILCEAMEMETAAIVVEPEKPLNLGLIARLTDNFQIDELRLVNPKLTQEGWRTAKIFSSHSRARLDGVKVFDALDGAISDMNLSIATSAMGTTTSSNIVRESMDVEALREILGGVAGKVAFVFGRDGTGLTTEEIGRCDLLLTIRSSPRYRTLNVACAAAIVFHEVYLLREEVEGEVPLLDRGLRDRLVEQFRRVATYSRTQPHRVERAVKAFSYAVNRGMLREREATLILGVLRKAGNQLADVWVGGGFK
ncbi:MAG: TrmH family RNA methyltransferase, partial [Candidatus Geothermarchaeales archaeon]